jgi:small conductance mechanosensitive channel
MAVCIVVIWLHLRTAPALSQPIHWDAAIQTVLSGIAGNYSRLGNEELGYVRLDGYPLFEVTASATEGTDDADSNAERPIERRINEIERNLDSIIRLDIDLNKLKVVPAFLNNQTVVLAVGEDRKFPIMTVRETDVLVADVAKPIEEVAQDRANTIKAALVRAQQERQPDYLWQQFRNTFQVLLVAGLLSAGIWFLERLLQHWRHRQPQLTAQAVSLPEEEANVRSGLEERDNQFSDSRPAVAEPPVSNLLQSRLAAIGIEEGRSIRHLLQILLRWGHVILWFISVVTILNLFPQTRPFARWLFKVPASYLLIVLIVSIAKSLVDIVIYYVLRRWAYHSPHSPAEAERIQLRLPSIIRILRDVSFSVSIVIVILWFLGAIGIPVLTILAALGLLGFAFQDLIKDWLAGCIILLEDQYTEGDVIVTGDSGGLVEYMSLRVTKLRNDEGELVSLSNGSFNQVRNLTHTWARVDMVFDIAYDMDVEKAIAVLEQVADDLYKDPTWNPFIIDPPELLGVEKFQDRGVTIRMWVKTVRFKHWAVGREFRRRLKPALDQADIVLSIQQRSIRFETPLLTDVRSPN